MNNQEKIEAAEKKINDIKLNVDVSKLKASIRDKKKTIDKPLSK
jgi:hypothetical protein